MLLIAFTFFQKFSGFVILGVLLVSLVYKLAIRIVELYPFVYRQILRKLWRIVTVTRSFYKIPKEVEFFHAVAILVVIASVLWIVVTKNTNGYAIFNYVFAMLLGSAAVFDASSRISWLVKKAWARVVGKLLFAGVGAVLVFVASSIAKQNVYELTHADPQYFQEFVGLLTSVYTPLFLGLAMCGFVLLFAGLELLGMILVFAILMTLSLIAQSFFGKQYGVRFFYRMRTGKKVSAEQELEPFEWKGMICLMRPLALVMSICIIVYSAWGLTLYFSPEIKDWGKRMLVTMHYHSNIECVNLEPEILIAEIKESNMVSVASLGSQISFSTKMCKRNSP